MNCMHRIKLLVILFAFVPAIVKSQDTVKIPVPIARQIVKDLTICDSAKSILELTTKQLILTEDKVVLKDSIITKYEQKCSMYDTMLINEKQKFAVQGDWLKTVRKENRSLKIRLLYTKISMSAIIGLLGYLFITK